jgi:hypothetical protein
MLYRKFPDKPLLFPHPKIILLRRIDIGIIVKHRHFKELGQGLDTVRAAWSAAAM